MQACARPDAQPSARRVRVWRAVALVLCLQLATCAATAAGAACGGSPQVQEASPSAVRRFAAGQGMKLLTFAGYSGAGYEDPQAMRAHAARILAANDPARTLVNIGATEQGIGEVYALAKARGFRTIGIVSTLARDEHVPLSPCVDRVFFVPDASWGGQSPQGGLAPTSAAIVAASDEMVLVGGGDIARDEALAARAAGKPVYFIAADMNHEAAREKARRRGQPEPADFRGAAHEALAK